MYYISWRNVIPSLKTRISVLGMRAKTSVMLVILSDQNCDQNVSSEGSMGCRNIKMIIHSLIKVNGLRSHLLES